MSRLTTSFRRTIPAGLLAVGLIAAGSVCVQAVSTAATLEAQFAQPPPSARPWVNWFWLNGNVTREGITADLEAMQRVGLGGAVLMDVSQDIPQGPVRFGTPEWHALFKHAVAEAGRLGLVLSMHNAPGWCGSGGPWITPELSMQKVVFATTNLTGPQLFEGPLPGLPSACRDIGVLAFLTLVGDGANPPGFAPKITSSGDKGFSGAGLLDGTGSASVAVPLRGKDSYLQLEFTNAYTASTLHLLGGIQKQAFGGVLQVSDDGRRYRTVREFVSTRDGLVLEFQPVTAPFFRIVFTQASTAGKELGFSRLALGRQYRIESFRQKSGMGLWTTSAKQGPFPAIPAYGIIAPDRLVDLSGSTNTEGRLRWQVPSGEWTLMRLASMPTGQKNHPPSLGGDGLECDKLSQEAVEAHFNAFLNVLADETAGLPAGAFGGTHVDSWEAGYQNWTPRFREEFRRRCGYDCLPYLPALSGRFLGSPEISERFLWDMRRTIADLIADNYAAHLAELAHRRHLELSIEAYGNGTLDYLSYAGRADVPMSEFWAEPVDHSRLHTSRVMASAAHTWGKSIVAAEAFTANPPDAKWQNHPFLLKSLADGAFCEGVNRFMFHRFAHQPWLDRAPGMTMGQWGIHYERTETWWEESKPWHEYLARCQWLLRSGKFVADLAYLVNEGAVNHPPATEQLQPPVPEGYNFDFISPEALLKRATVQNGHLILPDGMSYRLLVLPPTELMTPQLLRKLKQLADGGLPILGQLPKRSPSLAGFPKCDEEVLQLAASFRDPRPHALNPNPAQFPTGAPSALQPKLLSVDSLPAVLGRLQLPPDFQQLTPTPPYALRWIHRSINANDFYFVANSNAQPVAVDCRFRVQGKRPELWNPETGTTRDAPQYREEPDGTVVPVKLGPAGSVFVVFRAGNPLSDPVVSVTRNCLPYSAAELLEESGNLSLTATEPGSYQLASRSGKTGTVAVREIPTPVEITGPWKVSFPPGRGVPETVTFERLRSWTESSDRGVKYFSGTATYTKKFQLNPTLLGPNRRVHLDLGRVEVIATAKLNGQALGVLWKPPFVVDVTESLRPGENLLEVSVVNLWPNRLIGDEQLPEDCEWRGNWTESGVPLERWPDWLLQGKPSPTGRMAFTTWKHWTRSSLLLPSGLLGPVTLKVTERVPVVLEKSTSEPPTGRR